MTNCGYKLKPRGMTGGWEPVGDKPVLGGALGTCFDCYVMQEDGIYKIWFSWRPTRCIAYAESPDGIHWDNPRVVLTAVTGSSWEGHEVNRPTIVKKDGIYHMWYTGQMFAKETNSARSCIGYATSLDGIHWERREDPVLVPELPWEKITVMCPHVLWEEEMHCYRMWYSGGRMHEADAIGIATSEDGIHWIKDEQNPVFTPNPDKYWEIGKVEACFVDGITCFILVWMEILLHMQDWQDQEMVRAIGRGIPVTRLLQDLMEAGTGWGYVKSA